MLLEFALKLGGLCIFSNGDASDKAVDRNPARRLSLPDPGGDAIKMNDFGRALDLDFHDILSANQGGQMLNFDLHAVHIMFSLKPPSGPFKNFSPPQSGHWP